MLSRLKKFYINNERKLTAVALVLGFVIDNLTLTRIDLWFDNFILLSYLLLAGFGIMLMNLYEEGVWRGRVLSKIHVFLPLLVQFAFGGLFSGFIVFYMRSASLSATAFFVAFLVFILLGNEIFKKQYARLGFQIGIFYIALFSFLIFYVPVILNKIGDLVFVLSGVFSLILIDWFIKILKHFIPLRMREIKKRLSFGIFCIFAMMNVFYFTNIIPPLPLSLKDAGVYYSVERSNGGYVAVGENEKWYEQFLFKTKVFHRNAGEPVYVYSAVFAPTDLKTKVLHRWQYYNSSTEKWVTADTLDFPIAGGRDGGYRGYTRKQNVRNGLWRVDIVTENNKLLGRVKFEIKDTIGVVIKTEKAL